MDQDANRSIGLEKTVLTVRTLVLALGESVQSPWWRTSFFNETGIHFLERIYPRTVLQAAVHAAGKAACNLHDRSIGRRGAFHLFRLPDAIEMAIHDTDSDIVNSLLEELRLDLGNTSKLLDRLKELAVPSGIKVEGARKLGTAKELRGKAAYRRIADVYYVAFKNGRQSFPYFETDGGEAI